MEMNTRWLAPRPARGTAQVWARGLGWFSVGLGLAQVLMPRVVARVTGMPDGGALMRMTGVREIATGVGLLRARNPQPWIWARVGGDALDVASLVAGGMQTQARRRAGMALAAVAGVTALDVLTARKMTENRERERTHRDYSDRSGWPKGVDAVRGAARVDFDAPRDFRIPEALRPFEVEAAAGRDSIAPSAI